jgi:hypothetical protein
LLGVLGQPAGVDGLDLSLLVIIRASVRLYGDNLPYSAAQISRAADDHPFAGHRALLSFIWYKPTFRFCETGKLAPKIGVSMAAVRR